MYYVYILQCKDNSIYTGIAADICRRLREHLAGGRTCAKYTRSRGAASLCGMWLLPDKSAALRLEAAVKSLTRREKLELLSKNGNLSAVSFAKTPYVFCDAETTRQCFAAASGILSKEEAQALKQILVQNAARLESYSEKYDLSSDSGSGRGDQSTDSDGTAGNPSEQKHTEENGGVYRADRNARQAASESDDECVSGTASKPGTHIEIFPETHHKQSCGQKQNARQKAARRKRQSGQMKQINENSD